MSAKAGHESGADGLTYDSVGIATLRDEKGMRELAEWVTKTFDFNQARPLLPLGYYANVLRLSDELGLAISTDGVGTKILVAQDLARYDTIGIDCVAMNVNDIICVGARPVSMVDYVAVQQADAHFLGELAKGLHDGARLAGVNIPGGEIAQVREMIQGVRDGYAFDLVGTGVGVVHPDRLIVGEDIQPGDLVVGIASSGIHSNGLTLARRALFDDSELRASDFVSELGRTVGEELLEPTRIYVKEIVQMIDEGLNLKSLAHITSDGLMNLTRVKASVGYVIDKPLEAQSIFSLIKQRGRIDDAVMYHVFNMGCGFCVVVAPRDATRAMQIAQAHGSRANIIGYAVSDPQRRVWIPPRNLLGEGNRFTFHSEAPPPRPLG